MKYKTNVYGAQGSTRFSGCGLAGRLCSGHAHGLMRQSREFCRPWLHSPTSVGSAGCWPRRTVMATPLAPLGGQLRHVLMAIARSQGKDSPDGSSCLLTSPWPRESRGQPTGKGVRQGGLGKHSEVRRGGELGPFLPSATVVREGVIRGLKRRRGS